MEQGARALLGVPSHFFLISYELYQHYLEACSPFFRGFYSIPTVSDFMNSLAFNTKIKERRGSVSVYYAYSSIVFKCRYYQDTGLSKKMVPSLYHYFTCFFFLVQWNNLVDSSGSLVRSSATSVSPWISDSCRFLFIQLPISNRFKWIEAGRFRLFEMVPSVISCLLPSALR